MESTPPDVFSISYQLLFSVRVLHRYFLNFGATAFDAATPPDEMRKTLALVRNAYDVGHFWEILPDADTQEILRNQRMLFRQRADGFIVAVSTESVVVRNGAGVVTDRYDTPFLSLPDGLKLVFAVYPTDAFFMLYTDIANDVMKALAGFNQVFRLKNGPTGVDLPSHSLNTDETIRIVDLEDRPPGRPSNGVLRPALGFIEIEHGPPGRSLLGNNDRVQPTLTFNLRLRNRRTRWRYQDTNMAQFDLVENGRIDVSADGRKLPNPTPATTLYDPTDDMFYSIIY